MAAHHADKVDEPRCGMGTGDFDAILSAEPAFEHFIARHANAEKEIIARRAPAAFQDLHAETHPVGERSAIVVAPLVHRRRPELLDECSGLGRYLGTVESAFARAADR